MDADSARGHLNAVLYGVDFHPDLGDDTIRRPADARPAFLKLDAARWPDFAGTRRWRASTWTSTS
jgi:hypothetical protein